MNIIIGLLSILYEYCVIIIGLLSILYELLIMKY